jgi:cobalt-zinc-cadmium efflux system membrane fusion protein
MRGLAIWTGGLLLAGLGALAVASDEHGHGDREGHGAHEQEAHGEAHEAFTVATFERHGVVLGTAAPGEVDIGVELPGEVRPNGDRIAHLAPRFRGLVREVRKHVGDHVRAGEVLALIESENLAVYELKAAFDGTVIDKHITPGEAVSQDKPAFIVADLSTVWININVYQSALSHLRLGQPVVVASQGGAEVEGVVSYISPVVDQATRTATARVVLPNENDAWRPGLFVTATVFEPVAADVIVPRRALHTLDGRKVVFVVESEHFEARPVTMGRVGRTRAEITAGLAAGERFADERSFLVKAELAKGAAGHVH